MTPTTDPAPRSWVDVPAQSPFPIQNLPHGVFRRDSAAHLGAAIGEHILDLTLAWREGLFEATPLAGLDVFLQPNLNAFAAAGKPIWQAARARIRQLLRADEPVLRDNASLRERLLVPQKDVTLLLPVQVGDYTDFY